MDAAASRPPQSPPPAEQKKLALQLQELTLRAFELARDSAAGCLAALRGELAAPDNVLELERQLDMLDRQVDERMAEAIAGDPVAQARELLACAKFMVDLERIGDLTASFCNIFKLAGERLPDEDRHALEGMAAALEQMLDDVHRSFVQRNVELAVRVLYSDSEIDRLRNLIFIRHVEQREAAQRPGGIQIIFMAQALERAGDHAKNAAEEVCHLVTGHSLRHMARKQQKPDEVQFIDNIRKRLKAPERKRK